MSKDSSATYVHLHQPRLADVFEEFNRPHTSLTGITSSTNPTSTTAASSAAYNNGAPNIPSFLPIEDIYLAPQYQPVNPEDEDDVVPDQHAAFGIARAMDSRREIVWRDLGLVDLMRGMRLGPDRGGREQRRGVGAARKADWGRLGRKATCLR